MKRLYIICFVSIMAIFIITSAIVYYINISKPEERIIVRDYYELRTTECDVSPATDYYVLAVLNDKVVVYYSDFTTIYDYTNISISSLPINIKNQLMVGMEIKNLQELYEFLEAYSS